MTELAIDVCEFYLLCKQFFFCLCQRQMFVIGIIQKVSFEYVTNILLPVRDARPKILIGLKDYQVRPVLKLLDHVAL